MDNRDRFDTFTERARKVLSLAQEEAQRFNHNYIGTEHLLLGHVREGEGIAAGVLQCLRVNLKALRQATIQMLSPSAGADAAPSTAPPVGVQTTPLGRQSPRPYPPACPAPDRTLSLAQEEAQRFNHDYIGTEHLLLGLVRVEDGVAAQVLANLGVELTDVRNTVEFISGRGDRIVLGDLGLTPRAMKVMELAMDEARRLGHHDIGTGHLLLGLVREGEGTAADVLASLGVALERVRAETLRVLGEQGGAPEA